MRTTEDGASRKSLKPGEQTGNLSAIGAEIDALLDNTDYDWLDIEFRRTKTFGVQRAGEPCEQPLGDRPRTGRGEQAGEDERDEHRDHTFK